VTQVKKHPTFCVWRKSETFDLRGRAK